MRRMKQQKRLILRLLCRIKFRERDIDGRKVTIENIITINMGGWGGNRHWKYKDMHISGSQLRNAQLMEDHQERKQNRIDLDGKESFSGETA